MLVFYVLRQNQTNYFKLNRKNQKEIVIKKIKENIFKIPISVWKFATRILNWN
jgi:hypothetical protein